MRIDFNFPVSLDDAVERISSFNDEPIEQTLSRNPRMIDDNVLEDDEDIYLLAQPHKGHIVPYIIAKERLEENWKEHLRWKSWCDTQMLSTFCKLQNKIIKNRQHGT